MRRAGVTIARQRMSARHRRRAIQFRETAINMGGVLIKLGQFFSTRVDVMPKEYIEELARLQDTVPSVPFAQIKELIEAEFGRPLEQVFAEFNPTPQAAASLAQVHLAKLRSGEKVAVKVQRPDIGNLAYIDLATFAYLMQGVERFTSFGKRADIPMIVEEFIRTLGDELDFYREAWNAIRFREMFSDSKIIFIPKVYLEYTTTKVLTLEAIEGYKISDYESLEKVGIDRHEVASEIVQSYMKQVLDEGFFHADPHPGNLFVVAGPEITFVDFGMVGEITPIMKLSLREAIISIAKKDPHGFVIAFQKLGFIKNGIDLRPIERAVQWLFDQYGSVTTRDINLENLASIEEDMREIIRQQPITVPSQFAFLGRALSTLLGLATGLDPKFDFVAATKPYVENLTKFGGQGWQQLVMDEGKQLLMTAYKLPQQMADILEKAQKGELRVKVDAIGITNAIDRGNRGRSASARAMALGFLALAVIALLYLGFDREAYFFGALAAVVVIGLLRR